MFEHIVSTVQDLVNSCRVHGMDGALALLMGGAALTLFFLLASFPVGWMVLQRRNARLRILDEMAWAVERNLSLDIALAPLAMEAGRWGRIGWIVFPWQVLIDDVRGRAAAGLLLADACWPHRRFVGADRLAFLREAERAGRLGEALRAEVARLRSDACDRFEAKETLLYPVYLFGLIVAITYLGMGVLTFVLASMERGLQDMGIRGEGLYDGMRSVVATHPPLGLLLVLALLVLFWSWLRSGRESHGGGWLFVPGIGGVMRLQAARDFCESLAVLSSSGVPLPAALRDAARCARFVPYRRLAERLAEGLDRGEGAPDLIARERLFPRMVRELIVLGVRSGEPAAGCRFASRHLEAVLRVRRRTLRFVLGAVVLVAAGGVVLVFCSVVFGSLAQMQLQLLP